MLKKESGVDLHSKTLPPCLHITLTAMAVIHSSKECGLNFVVSLGILN
jgi:hypothetical protein